MSVIAFSSVIGPVPIDCIISEKLESTLDITEIPIENGSRVSDHAVVMPKKVTLDLATGNAAATYAALERFQESRVPFTMVTGLKVFTSMLVKRISAERDATFSKILKATVDLQEVILVGTSYVADPAGDNANRGNPGGKKSTRAAPPSADRASGIAAERASGTVQLGDSAVKSASTADQSYLSSIFGAQ
ncbi:MAG: phage baseplate protein [Allorhizobium sp.]